MRPFFIIWLGQAFSRLGSQIVQFALIWYLTNTTGSATVLAIASIVGLLPQVTLGPLAGTLVDRWDRRKVLIFADGIIALATVILAFLFAFGRVQIWHIYSLMFIRALGGAFHSPAMTASTTLLVPQKHLVRIQGLNGALNGVIGIFSPMLGALLLNLIPMQAIMAIDIGTALFAILPLFFIPIPRPKQKDEKEVLSILADLADGIKFLWSLPGLWLITLSHAAIYLLMMPAYSLIPIYVTDYLRGGALQLAWLQSSLAVGIVVGGLLLSVWGGFRRQVVTVLLATLISGLSWVVMGVTPQSSFYIAVGAIFLGTTMNSIMVGSVSALGQTIIPPEMQGRLFAISITIINAMSATGLAIAGPTVDRVGVRFWFLLGGIVTTILGIVPFFIPVVMEVEQRKIPETVRV
ncbi:MAG: MFS transporter [Anaerolineales bacterium]|jgi:DHA3 family macrolide efflux protein-like MFS transporter